MLSLKQRSTNASKSFSINSILGAISFLAFDNFLIGRIKDFFSDIEGNYISVLNKIHDRKKLSSQDRINLAVFVAFIQTRVPWFRSEIDKMASEHIANVGLEEAKRDFTSSLETIGKIIS